MRITTWELPCPECGVGKVRLRELPSRDQIDAALPVSMRSPPLGVKDRLRFEPVKPCARCGVDGAAAAARAESEGLPDDAVDVSSEPA